MTLSKIDSNTFNLLNRSLIGFDRMLNELDYRVTNYPPYNVLKHSEDKFEIQLAVSGFKREDIEVSVDGNQLKIKAQQTSENFDGTFLHRGIATRSFERVFSVADHMEINDAKLESGILSVTITRVVPEEFKPRLIAIN